jgi:hypothetical protein
MDRLVATGQQDLGWCQVPISSGSRTILLLGVVSVAALVAFEGLRSLDFIAETFLGGLGDLVSLRRSLDARSISSLSVPAAQDHEKS